MDVVLDRKNTHAQAAEHLRTEAARGTTISGITSASVDVIYYVDADRLAALVSAAAGDQPRLFSSPTALALVRDVVDRAGRGRGGFFVTEWPEGPQVFAELLGAADRAQIGGAMPRAAWALSEIGADTVVALRDRSDAQLDVLDGRIGLVTDGALQRVAETSRTGGTGKPPHLVLEFIAGTVAGEVRVPRSTRLVLSFGMFGIEVDDDFVDWAVAESPASVLVSGLTFARIGAADFAWVSEATTRFGAAGCHVYHELTEFPDETHLAAALDAVQADSLGLSLSELPGTGSPAMRAMHLAEHANVQRVVVHADDWSMSVHRSDPRREERALWGGNVLASARAAAGRPTATLELSDRAVFSDDIPPSESLSNGWIATTAPSAYLADPAATIGLGDTFTGGFLLAHAAD